MSEFQHHNQEDYNPPVPSDMEAHAIAEAYAAVEKERQLEAEAGGVVYEQHIMGITHDKQLVSIEKPFSGEGGSIVRIGNTEGMFLGGELQRYDDVDSRPQTRGIAGPDSGASIGPTGAEEFVVDGKKIRVPDRNDWNSGKERPTIDGKEIYPVGPDGRPGAAVSGSANPAESRAAAPFGATIKNRPHAPKPKPERGSRDEPRIPAAAEDRSLMPDPRLAGAPKENFRPDHVERLKRNAERLAAAVDMAFGGYAENIVKDPQTGAEQLDLYVSSERAKGTSAKGVRHELFPSKLRLTRTWDEHLKTHVISLEVDPSKSNDKVHPMVRDYSGSKSTLFVAPGEPAVFVEGKMHDGRLVQTPNESNTASLLSSRADFWEKVLREGEPRSSRFRRAIRFLGKSATGNLEE